MKNSDQAIWKFLEDDQFIKWALDPDATSDAWWQNWMLEHPEQVSDLLMARDMARSLHSTEEPGATGVRELSTAIWTAISAATQGSATGNPPAISAAGNSSLGRNPRSRRILRYAAAACLTGLLTAGVYKLYHHTGKTPPAMPALAQSRLVKQDLERANLSSADQVLYLVDGTKITLRPGARIRHIAYLQKDKREVFLEGDAFFDVAKDPARPFYVFSKDLQVRVLGTSFQLATDEKNGDVRVLVHTGKVAVSKKADSSDKGQALILTSHQMALYRAQSHDLVPTAPDSRDLRHGAIPASSSISFEFDETPVTGIFKTLEQAYGIPLHYDEKTFAGCIVTTSLADETFEEKVRIVCEAIGAHYRMSPDGVYIEGRPCK